MPFFESRGNAFASAIAAGSVTGGIIVEILTIICIGLMTGVEFCIAAFINPIFAQLPDTAKNTAISLGARQLGRVMPFWYMSGLLLLVTESVVKRHSSHIELLWSASLIWAVAIVLSIFFLVPINNRIVAAGASAFSEELRRQHDRWHLLHRWRVAALVLAMTMFLLGVQA
ncbi:MAG TPA: DUF1772 domain-containing protein [Bryobacteraceae bacterium]